MQWQQTSSVGRLRSTTLLILHWNALFPFCPVDALFISLSRIIARSSSIRSTSRRRNNNILRHQNVVPNEREVDLCIIGGGVSGLAAAISVAQKLPSTIDDITSPTKLPSILLLESTSNIGGRVQSDITPDGYILDKGFAVFVEEYPMSKQLLDYDALGLQPFLPGARVKLKKDEVLARVSDPIRRPKDILKILTSPVGSLRDKLRLVPLFHTIFTKSIEELFLMEERDTLSCLRSTYHFSEEFISAFFAPFLEGIYLAPLHEQSSRMFHFVMKMFTVGSVSLPKGGMQAVADQLDTKARKLGVDIQLESRVISVVKCGTTKGGRIGDASEYSSNGFVVEVDSKGERSKQLVNARCVIIATDIGAASKLISNSSEKLGVNYAAKSRVVPPKQRSVGCIYYAFQSPAPLTDPILILNGEGNADDLGGSRNSKEYPINNVCFPSVVQRGYAPAGFELCSVSILEKALTEHVQENELDGAVRRQLSSWFPDYSSDILDETRWVRKGLYVIPHAQPAHYDSSSGKDVGCASVHGGRDCSTFQGMELPRGMFVCGDHMATSTLNGAFESGVNAGGAAIFFLLGEECKSNLLYFHAEEKAGLMTWVEEKNVK